MVCNLTIGKKNYEAVSDDLKQTLAKAEELRAELTAGIDEDVVAFNTVMGAYGLPRGDRRREGQARGGDSGRAEGSDAGAAGDVQSLL